MNQAILFNDDLQLLQAGVWQLSGFYQGQQLTFKLLSSVKIMNDETKLDWEMQIEDWLEQNEPEQNLVEIKLD